MVTDKRKKYKRGEKTKPPLSRRKEGRTPRARTLIVCNAGKTEPNYFLELKKRFRLSVKIIREPGVSPTRVVERAAKESRDRIDIADEYGELRNKNIWCIFDKDEYPDYEEAIREARSHGFSVACSNPCFELWYLLHFKEQNSRIDSKKAFKELKKEQCIPQYEKDMINVLSILEEKGNVNDAVARAEALRTMHSGKGKPESGNPSTSVDLLYRFLEKASKKK